MDDDNRSDFNVLSHTTDIEIAIEKKITGNVSW